MFLSAQRQIALHAAIMVAYLSRTTTASLTMSSEHLRLTEKPTQKLLRSNMQHHVLSSFVAEAALPVAPSVEGHHASAFSLQIALLCTVAIVLCWAVRAFQTYNKKATKAAPTKVSEDHQEVCSAAPSVSQECLSNLEAQRIVEGTPLICTEETDIFESTDSWDAVDTIAAGSRLTAAAPPVQREGFMMIPIKPEGAIEASVVRVEVDGIVEGTTLLCTEEADVFEDVYSWDAIDTVFTGARLVAAAPPVMHEGFTMIPIKPKGAVEASSFQMEV